MDDTNLKKDQPIPEVETIYKRFINRTLPSISLPNQDGNLLKLNRYDTFRIVIYFYSMTGNPDKKLPKNWHQIKLLKKPRGFSQKMICIFFAIYRLNY